MAESASLGHATTSLIPPCPQARSQQEAQRAALQGAQALWGQADGRGEPVPPEAGHAEQGVLHELLGATGEPHLGSWGRPGIASVTGCGVMRQGNKQLRTKGETQSWMSLQNSPGSRKILDKRKTNTMNLSERLPWVCWAQVCLGTIPRDSPSRTLVGSSHCVPALLASAQVTSSRGEAQVWPSSRCHTSFAAGAVKLFEETRCDEPC